MLQVILYEVVSGFSLLLVLGLRLLRCVSYRLKGEEGGAEGIGSWSCDWRCSESAQRSDEGPGVRHGMCELVMLVALLLLSKLWPEIDRALTVKGHLAYIRLSEMLVIHQPLHLQSQTEDEVAHRLPREEETVTEAILDLIGDLGHYVRRLRGPISIANMKYAFNVI